MDSWLNAVRWTDDIVRDIILGFRERGLEQETLFVMYSLVRLFKANSDTATMEVHS